MEKLTFTIDGYSFSTAFNTAAKREQCAEKILSTTVDITAGTKKTLEIKIGFFMTLSSTKSEISMT